MAEDMKRNNGFIPGVRPGKDTADYIDTVMSRLRDRSFVYAFIAIMPSISRIFKLLLMHLVSSLVELHCLILVVFVSILSSRLSHI